MPPPGALRIPASAIALVAFGLSPAVARTLRIGPGPDSLRSAQTAILSDSGITDILLAPGRYPLAAPVALSGPGRPVTWRAERAGTAVLDGGGVTTTALVVSGRNVTIRGLEIRNFTQNGVVVTNADHVTIARNHIADISSTAWSQSAIHGGVRATHVVITHNAIERTGYAAILFETNATGDLSSLTIIGNRITDVCRVKADCGAIYVNGRSHRNRATLIADNVVRDYGPAANATKGLYLDDGLSGAVVRGNDVSGTGSYPIHIHGGSDNLVEHNRFAGAGHFLLYQSLPGTGGPAMHGNRIRSNRVSTIAATFSGAGTDRPDLSSNVLIR
jgi:hypothetical protein